jgi:hypothetical protein
MYLAELFRLRRPRLNSLAGFNWASREIYFLARIRDLSLEFRRFSDLGDFLEFIDFLPPPQSIKA